MNADWAKGKNERTGQEGIFPRSYVQIIDEKSPMGMMAPPQTPAQAGSSSSGGYGNVPMDVAQSGSGGGESKFNEHGKKFGKKMGNAGKWFSLPLTPSFGDLLLCLKQKQRLTNPVIQQPSSAPAPPSVPTSSAASSSFPLPPFHLFSHTFPHDSTTQRQCFAGISPFLFLVVINIHGDVDCNGLGMEAVGFVGRHIRVYTQQRR